MKLKQYYLRFSVLFMSLAIFPCGKAYSQTGPVQDDPVLAPNAAVVPVIDGMGNDSCWQKASWQSIAQVWIPYDDAVDSSDYAGRYKVIWSSSTNLLYFLIEVTDDVFVDGFIPGVTEAIYNYDIVEVFIDENKSGGLHIFDGVGSDTTQFGSNAENAFAYHTYSAFPADGEMTTDHYVYDMDGSNWGTSQNMDYTSHIPSFSLRKTGNTAVWEFSLIVYKDNYENTMPDKNVARSQLAVDKEMGLSVAYCDNDDPTESPIIRDNMFGSVWEPEPGNWHWQNANYFGHVKLVSQISGVQNRQPVAASVVKLFPNPASSNSQFEVNNTYRGKVLIRMYNLLGQEVAHINAFKSEGLFRQSIPLYSLSAGTYFVKIHMGNIVYGEKLLVVPHR
jgi:hypothetical protein